MSGLKLLQLTVRTQTKAATEMVILIQMGFQTTAIDVFV